MPGIFGRLRDSLWEVKDKRKQKENVFVPELFLDCFESCLAHRLRCAALSRNLIDRMLDFFYYFFWFIFFRLFWRICGHQNKCTCAFSFIHDWSLTQRTSFPLISILSMWNFASSASLELPNSTKQIPRVSLHDGREQQLKRCRSGKQVRTGDGGENAHLLWATQFYIGHTRQWVSHVGWCPVSHKKIGWRQHRPTIHWPRVI